MDTGWEKYYGSLYLYLLSKETALCANEPLFLSPHLTPEVGVLCSFSRGTSPTTRFLGDDSGEDGETTLTTLSNALAQTPCGTCESVHTGLYWPFGYALLADDAHHSLCP